jgi:serine/threonine protein kinase
MSEVGVGDLVDNKYRIIRLIGEGGWGVVYEAENGRTLKRVAVKLLRPRPELSDDIRMRFEREAQAAGRIGSEHIVEVFDLGTLADGTHYMVMELLHGQDLASRLESGGPLDPVLAAKLVVQLLDGLGAAHDAGILHRDLKPENLFLVPTRTGEDFLKILDFGISKFNAPELTSATVTGAVLGSPVYMAPEQARGLKHVDARTDLYSVGALLFEALTGRVPFTGENFNDLMFKIALAPRPNPASLRPDLDGPLAHLVIKAIAADPKERFQTAVEFRAALAEWLAEQGVTSIAAPEMRRGSNTTPRFAGSGRRASHPHTPHTPQNQWDATMPSENSPASQLPGAATPLAAASTLGRGAPPRQKGVVFAAAGGAVGLLVVAIMVVTWSRRSHHSDAPAEMARPTAASIPAATPVAETAVLAPPKTAAPASAEPPPQEDAPPTSEAAVVGHRSLPAWVHAGRTQPKSSGSSVSVSAPPSASHSESASASVSPPPSAPPPPIPAASAAPKGVDKVEGREFRTGL